jgi:hypothetical protein
LRGDTEVGATESRGARDNLTSRRCAKNRQSEVPAREFVTAAHRVAQAGIYCRLSPQPMFPTVFSKFLKPAVIACDDNHVDRLRGLLGRYGLRLEEAAPEAPIPGSYWGAPEAGLVGATVYVRRDTPLHSALHEAAHVICMDPERRARLHTDAGGDYAEEDAVCYLQIVLAQQLGVSAAEICADMDAWGYTFRLGGAYAWFTRDAGDAREWLVRHGLLGDSDVSTWRFYASELTSGLKQV